MTSQSIIRFYAYKDLLYEVKLCNIINSIVNEQQRCLAFFNNKRIILVRTVVLNDFDNLGTSDGLAQQWAISLASLSNSSNSKDPFPFPSYLVRYSWTNEVSRRRNFDLLLKFRDDSIECFHYSMKGFISQEFHLYFGLWSNLAFSNWHQEYGNWGGLTLAFGQTHKRAFQGSYHFLLPGRFLGLH